MLFRGQELCAERIGRGLYESNNCLLSGPVIPRPLRSSQRTPTNHSLEVGFFQFSQGGRVAPHRLLEAGCCYRKSVVTES